MSLGSNMGDREGTIRAAWAALDDLPDTRLLTCSRFFRTEPVGKVDQDWFINAAALLETALDPEGLLRGFLGIEQRLGRVRRERWGPRTIDLDLLFYGEITRGDEALTLPHPRLHERRFVLAPLAEVAPDWMHPETGLTPGQMLARLPEAGQRVIPL